MDPFRLHSSILSVCAAQMRITNPLLPDLALKILQLICNLERSRVQLYCCGARGTPRNFVEIYSVKTSLWKSAPRMPIAASDADSQDEFSVTQKSF
jgi:hypothetical protein